jgi:arylsulfatase A-like enzyme
MGVVPRRRTQVSIAIVGLGLLATAAALAFTVAGLRWRGPLPTASSPLLTTGLPAGPTTTHDVNVVLVSIDTLRADHLGCYGYERATSPRIDAISERAVVFEKAIAPAPSTLPSHASMFTSVLPSRHGALWSTRTPLSEAATTLAELMRDAGYDVVGFHGGGQVAGELGLGQGFDAYVEVPGRFRKCVARAIEWLDTRPEKPFFLFLHTYEVHHPYGPPANTAALFDDGYAGNLPDTIKIDLLRRINGRTEPPLKIDAADLAHIVALYDAEIRSMDAALGRLLDALGERGLLDNALVIITSDHGEEFDEHGWVGWHSHTLYDELLHVPLIVKLPGDAHAGTRVAPLVRLLDVAPTVLDILRRPRHPDFDGTSVMPLVRGEPEHPRAAVSQRDEGCDPPISALRTADWKLYEDRLFWRLYRARLFDLRTDPDEQRNVLAGHHALARRLSSELRTIEARRPKLTGEKEELSPQLLRRLRSLGYVD